MSHSEDEEADDLRDERRLTVGDVLAKQCFSDDIERTEMALGVLSYADQLCHVRIAMTESLAPNNDEASAVERITHLAVSDLEDRVSEHLKRLKGERAAEDKAAAELQRAQMKQSIQLLYIAEPPEFLEAHEVSEPLSEKHADLLASWLLGEGWHHA